MGDEKAEENLRKIKLPKTYVNLKKTPHFYLVNVYGFGFHGFIGFLVSYVMSSGYKPAPLDLNHVKLTPNQNQLVEKLAENGHNVWARDRVRQGWTYSIMQVQ